MKLFTEDIRLKKLPVSGIQFHPTIYENTRRTFIKYYDQYIMLTWMTEPPAGYQTTILKILSRHAGIEVSEDQI